MKPIILSTFFFLLLWSTNGFSQQNKISIQINQPDKQLLFAGEEIKKSAEAKGYKVNLSELLSSKIRDGIVVKIISDSALSLHTARTNLFKMPPQYGWQCYSIRIQKTEKQHLIYVLAGDKTGAMYGGLDIAEALRLGTIENLADSDNKPFIERRGIKFNLPLDLRTPSYSDLSDAFQQNIPVVWDMEFWKQQFDEMARNRYNAITYWSLNPFPSLVRVPEFPEIALDDVWRTTANFEHRQEYNGKDLVTPELLKDHELVKEMTIDEKISFWKEVMEYASNRGIENYFFTWNIFTNGELGKYGITESRSNDTTIAYFRASVREMVLTYPHLAGIGITAGENMGGKHEKYTNEQWLWKTYGEGIKDALAEQPGRNIRLIHRFHMTGLADILNNFKDYPGILDLSIKYSIAHMYSIPNPPFAKGAFEILPENIRTWLTVRNDDIYSFRWGNPDFARQYIKEIPGPEKVAGYYMGSDGYCLGRDFLGKDKGQPRPLLIQKQWYSYMLWGRLSYDPELPDVLFRQTLETRFPETNAEILMDAWSASSMVFPWATRLIWGDIDLKWLPEACISSPVYKGFYTVRDVMEVDPMRGSNIQNITEWAQNYRLNRPGKLMSPLAAADSLSKYSRLAMISLRKLPALDPGSFDELNQTLGDIEAFATIGFYYSEKIRGACSLALFNFYGLEQDKTEAVEHLTNARDYWISYAKIYDSKYKPAMYNRVGYVDIPSLIEKTEKDIEIAREWKPGDIKEYSSKTRTENSFHK